MIPTGSDKAVLDTNIWLDWLVFDDGAVKPLMQTGLVFVASQAMRDELSGVLARPHFQLNAEQREHCLSRFNQTTTSREAPDYSVTRLRCTDRDDQKFIELAVATSARFLVTRDKALLKLAKRASQEHNLTVVKASHWQDSKRSV